MREFEFIRKTTENFFNKQTKNNRHLYIKIAVIFILCYSNIKFMQINRCNNVRFLI